ncbi:hypothetical protein JXA85_07345 [Candidatus Woesearchaeota archaeon]|nr:hypothetical protein [Candidatus Woesearchaeota archaeon]
MTLEKIVLLTKGKISRGFSENIQKTLKQHDVDSEIIDVNQDTDYDLSGKKVFVTYIPKVRDNTQRFLVMDALKALEGDSRKLEDAKKLLKKLYKRCTEDLPDKIVSLHNVREVQEHNIQNLIDKADDLKIGYGTVFPEESYNLTSNLDEYVDSTVMQFDSKLKSMKNEPITILTGGKLSAKYCNKIAEKLNDLGYSDVNVVSKTTENKNGKIEELHLADRYHHEEAARSDANWNELQEKVKGRKVIVSYIKNRNDSGYIDKLKSVIDDGTLDVEKAKAVLKIFERRFDSEGPDRLNSLLSVVEYQEKVLLDIIDEANEKNPESLDVFQKCLPYELYHNRKKYLDAEYMKKKELGPRHESKALANFIHSLRKRKVRNLGVLELHAVGDRTGNAFREGVLAYAFDKHDSTKPLNVLNISTDGHSTYNGEGASFDDLNIPVEELSPYTCRIDELAKEKAQKYKINDELARRLFFCLIPDEGDDVTGHAFAGKNKIACLETYKDRDISSDVDSGDLPGMNVDYNDMTQVIQYLDGLKDNEDIKKIQSENIEIEVVLRDDFRRTLGTANCLMVKINDTVDQYNNKHGTRFKVNNHLYIPHNRQHWMGALKEKNYSAIDDLVGLNTIPQCPPEAKQLERLTVDRPEFNKLRNNLTELKIADQLCAQGIRYILKNAA